MKIENINNLEKQFKDIEIGEVFSFKDKFYGDIFCIKTTTIYDACGEDCEPDEYNSVNLCTGIHHCFNDDTLIVPYPNAILKIS